MTTNTAAAEIAPDILLREQQNGILRLTMNRPAQRNPLSEAMIAALHGAIDDASADPSVRVVIIAA
jgi:enoyl-CoA hydratase/carnithine racemase